MLDGPSPAIDARTALARIRVAKVVEDPREDVAETLGVAPTCPVDGPAGNGLALSFGAGVAAALVLLLVFGGLGIVLRHQTQGRCLDDSRVAAPRSPAGPGGLGVEIVRDVVEEDHEHQEGAGHV